MESKLELSEVDLFIVPLSLPEGRYLCQTDINLFAWVILSNEDIERNIEKGPERAGVIHAYGPLPE
jgi:hypothetical protein